jgi:hypothetical protein
MKSPKAKAKTHFVPRAIYRRAFAGVVPLCVAACGGSTVSAVRDAGGDAADDAYLNGGVGCSAFCGVAAMGFDSGADGPAPYPPDAATDAASPSDAGDAAATPDAIEWTVACLGFCGVGITAFGDGGDSG